MIVNVITFIKSSIIMCLVYVHVSQVVKRVIALHIYVGPGASTFVVNN